MNLSEIELGASFFIENNRYFKELVNLTGNKIVKYPSNKIRKNVKTQVRMAPSGYLMKTMKLH